MLTSHSTDSRGGTTSRRTYTSGRTRAGLPPEEGEDFSSGARGSKGLLLVRVPITDWVPPQFHASPGAAAPTFPHQPDLSFPAVSDEEYPRMAPADSSPHGRLRSSGGRPEIVLPQGPVLAATALDGRSGPRATVKRDRGGTGPRQRALLDSRAGCGRGALTLAIGDQGAPPIGPGPGTPSTASGPGWACSMKTSCGSSGGASPGDLVGGLEYLSDWDGERRGAHRRRLRDSIEAELPVRQAPPEMIRLRMNPIG